MKSKPLPGIKFIALPLHPQHRDDDTHAYKTRDYLMFVNDSILDTDMVYRPLGINLVATKAPCVYAKRAKNWHKSLASK